MSITTLHKKTFNILAAFLLVLLFGAATSALAKKRPVKTVTLLDGRLELAIPQTFTPMDEETARLKYPSERRPPIIFSNDAGTVNVAINFTRSLIPAGEFQDLRNALQDNIERVHPTVAWFRSEGRSTGEQPYFLFDFRTPALDTDIRNLMYGAILKGRLLLISVNMTKELEPQWLETANEIIKSIKVVK